jgi:acyl carrier protein
VLTHADSYVAPSSELEKRVCQLWGEVLGIPLDQIGIQDDFFRLGGNSILAIKLASKLNKELGSSVETEFFFKNSTIHALVCHVNDIANNNDHGEEEYVF